MPIEGQQSYDGQGVDAGLFHLVEHGGRRVRGLDDGLAVSKSRPR
jgi:hypothetical protein